MFELGNSLREARVRQALEYSQVELATKIRAKYIRALEDEAFEILPSETYVKGFLRSYAEHLGLDGQLYVDEYNSRYGGERYADEPPRRARVHQDRGLERKVVLAALAGIAALTALVIVAWKFGGSNTTNGGLPTVSAPAAKPTALVLRGVGRGTYFEVYRGHWTRLTLNETISKADEPARLTGTRFWIMVKRPRGIAIHLGGRPVPLGAARRKLCLFVTPVTTRKLTTCP